MTMLRKLPLLLGTSVLLAATACAKPVTPGEKAMLQRATSDKGFHYYGEGRFFILLGKAFADTMLELTGQGNKVLPPKLNGFAPPGASRAPASE
jgi:hypothetical protein